MTSPTYLSTTKPNASSPPNSSGIDSQKCTVHSQESLKWFCTQCNVFVCGDCIVETHNGHKIQRLKDLEIGWKKYDLSGTSPSPSLPPPSPPIVNKSESLQVPIVNKPESLQIVPVSITPKTIVRPDTYYKYFASQTPTFDTVSKIYASEKHGAAPMPANSSFSTQYISGAQFHTINPHVIKMTTEDFIDEVNRESSINKFISNNLNNDIAYSSFEYTHLGHLMDQWNQLNVQNDIFLVSKQNDHLISQSPTPPLSTINNNNNTESVIVTTTTTTPAPPPKPTKYEFMVNDTVVSKSMNYLRQACELVVNDLSVGNESTEKYIKENTIRYIYCLCGMENTQHLSLVEVYDIQQNRWGLAEGSRMKRACSSSSVVSILDYVYIFGGNDSLSTYERMDLYSGKWDCLDNIQTTGGSSMAAVWDEGRYIYLVGGIQNNNTLGRVDRFDIMTGRCSNLGQLKRPRYYCFACYLDGIIYVIGGTHKEPEKAYTMVNDIEAFSISDGSSKQIYQFNNSSSRVEGFCFDKREYIYFLTSTEFCRFSVFTRKAESLAEVPVRDGKFGLSLVFGFVNNFPKIYLIGGKHPTNFIYDINSNSWDATFPSKSKYTYFHGAVGVGEIIPKASDTYQMQLQQQKAQQNIQPAPVLQKRGAVTPTPKK
ncbi:hypothetical protein DFA_08315 [Cavenderia fasciculata]|uniref:B box-type domain-containing protein n=1 Tax=Cavenderia fasciculata TaxID=261658 RepID=F4Q5R3_CACFS|nr:uncharacterized protein DFA_08315 [Cavenderia fasciculata]EGG17322.1 hypothetical protein DFA_08315 [Cavenderia fasciculata]|eukprot:XP_004355806.1 hypothetical protein DFA_08315 [Cavenderia fasciculata]